MWRKVVVEKHGEGIGGWETGRVKRAKSSRV